MIVSSPSNLSTGSSPKLNGRNGFYHIETNPDSEHIGSSRVERFLAAFEAILEYSNYRFLLDLYARTSAKCGRCAVTCQVYQASQDPRDIPCYRTNLILDVYRHYLSPASGLMARLNRNNYLTNSLIDEMAEVFYRCTACRRCRNDCPMGIDHGLIAHLGRYVLSEAGIEPRGLVVSVREQLEGKTGNTSAIPLPALIDNLEFLEEELEEMKGTAAPFPIDVEGAEYIFFPAVSDFLMEADTLMGIVAVLKAAGISWTIGSGYFDGINYGLFYNDWVLERIIARLVVETKRLHASQVLIGECGHAARSAKQYVPAFAANEHVPVTSILELTWKLIQQGKVKLDPTVISERVTYHDPCNIARSGWIIDEPRRILRSFVRDFVEMQPHGRQNYCCGGGGGLVSLDETYEFRMEIAGKAKARQIQASGADIVATPCANCKKQLRELVDFYHLPVQIVGVHDLILRAIQMDDPLG